MKKTEATETFEEKLARLEKIVSELEAGECGLDHAMALFEEGVSLTAACEQKLTAARQKITELTAIDSADKESGDEDA